MSILYVIALSYRSHHRESVLLDSTSRHPDEGQDADYENSTISLRQPGSSTVVNPSRSQSGRLLRLLKTFGGRKAEAKPPKFDSQDHILSTKRDYSHVIETTDSLVTFILEGLQNIGGNLPGIGAIAVVLSAMDKFIVFTVFLKLRDISFLTTTSYRSMHRIGRRQNRF